MGGSVRGLVAVSRRSGSGAVPGAWLDTVRKAFMKRLRGKGNS